MLSAKLTALAWLDIVPCVGVTPSHQVFKLIDTSGDGSVSLAEFLKFAKRNSTSTACVHAFSAWMTV